MAVNDNRSKKYNRQRSYRLDTPLAVHPQAQSTILPHLEAIQWEDGAEGAEAGEEDMEVCVEANSD